MADYGKPELECCLPMPTSVNKMYSTVRNHGRTRRIKSPDYREWQSRALSYLVPYGWKEPIRGDVALWCFVCFNDLRDSRQTMDIQNRIKATWHLLEVAGFYKNDKQIVDIRFQKGPTVTDIEHVLGGEGYISLRLWEVK